MDDVAAAGVGTMGKTGILPGLPQANVHQRPTAYSLSRMREREQTVAPPCSQLPSLPPSLAPCSPSSTRAPPNPSPGPPSSKASASD
ncbi:hypothetical protein CBM2609_B30304 [Cupriavidus taiwanensis]|nr:hypothetical protein CBM2604_B40301 [Cupriavidus taiwanensis]SOZ32624.1 hypothetical protein CBM2609_B30304 [Cupriavidus taiwanensis]SOZ48220.1 hypothetical protein CBM2610_B30301 [Cupriavidus taiwanensis]